MRTQEAIDAWREVLEIDARDFRALAALETAVHAGGALGGVRSTSSSGRRRRWPTRRSRSTC